MNTRFDCSAISRSDEAALYKQAVKGYDFPDPVLGGPEPYDESTFDLKNDIHFLDLISLAMAMRPVEGKMDADPIFCLMYKEVTERVVVWRNRLATSSST